MSDFGRQQLAKFGWKEGSGLGKKNQGILNPLKPNLKFDNTGLGHDKAEDFNNHWWERVYNDASSNVVVDKRNDKITMGVKDPEDGVEITTNNYSVKKLKKLNKSSGQAYNNFLKVSTLNGANVSDETDIGEQLEKIQLSKAKPLTDEELFKACGGRTAHKGARHGLKLSGKLARLAEQDRELTDSLRENRSDPTNAFTTWTSVKSKKFSKKKKCQQPAVPDYIEEDSEELKGIIDDTDYKEFRGAKRQKKKIRIETEISESLLASLNLDSVTPPKKVSFHTQTTTIYSKTHPEPASSPEKAAGKRKGSRKKRRLIKRYQDDAAEFPETPVAEVVKTAKKRKAEEPESFKKPVSTPPPTRNLRKSISDDDDNNSNDDVDSIDENTGLKPYRPAADDVVPLAKNAFDNLVIEDEVYAKRKKREKRLKRRKTKFEKNLNLEKNVKFPIMKTIKKNDAKKQKKKILKLKRINMKKIDSLSDVIENFAI